MNDKRPFRVPENTLQRVLSQSRQPLSTPVNPNTSPQIADPRAPSNGDRKTIESVITGIPESATQRQILSA
jgi:hypothetical protein